jgi:predicted phosphodiesterase
MGQTLALLSDIHGNVAALDAALADIKASKADRIVILGDLALNGPRPSETVARVMELDAAGAIVIAGNTDIAVADGDYAAAFPWLDDVPSAHQAAAEWARDQLADEQLDYLRRLPAERRLWSGDDLVLACHASPGSQTSGLPADLDASLTVQRVTRTDARVIACGHTHVADSRELGRKLIVNPGSCGYAFDGSPDACWGLLELPDDGDPRVELRRPTYDAQAASIEVSARGLPGDVYRAATIRTGRFVR